MADTHFTSLTQTRDLLAKGEVKAAEVVGACARQIAGTEPRLNALITPMLESAMDQARQLDTLGPDPGKPLWGVPLTIKDVIAVAGTRTTCGSGILANFTPFYDATCVERLKSAGAIIIGKANMDEFAMGSSTENSHFGPTRNPWNFDAVPGGSSGGSAAGVAAGQAYGSVGTDTGGSIRQPASFCGCVGLKPTYGRVSRYGLIAYGSSLDQAGPLTRTVADNAAMLQVIAGHDPRDSTSADVAVPDFQAAVSSRADLKGLRLGLPAEFWGQGLDPEVEQCLRGAMKTAEALGATLVEVSLPHTRYAVSTYYIVAMAEASSNLARFDGVRYGLRDEEAAGLLDMYIRSRTRGFGAEVQRRIMIGTYVLSAGYYDAYYRKAAQVRRLIRQDFLDAFEQCDILCGPASPVTAWKLGTLNANPLQMYLMDIFTISLNLAGLPGLSLPVGIGQTSGLPVGLQLLGRAFDEQALYAAAGVLERSLPSLGTPRGLQTP